MGGGFAYLYAADFSGIFAGGGGVSRVERRADARCFQDGVAVDRNETQNVVKLLAEKTGFNHIAFKVVVIEKMPRNEAGKIMYSELNNFDV